MAGAHPRRAPGWQRPDGHCQPGNAGGAVCVRLGLRPGGGRPAGRRAHAPVWADRSGYGAALARPFGGDSHGAEWWVRGMFTTPWLPTAFDLVEPAAVFRAACDSLGRRIGKEGVP